MNKINNTAYSKMRLMTACALMSISMAGFAGMPAVATEPSEGQSEAQNEEQVIQQEVVYIPVYNPNTDTIVLKRCEDYPRCDNNVDYQLTDNKTDNQ